MDPLSARARPRLATVWLGGCSGCHMSLLDLDEALLEQGAVQGAVRKDRGLVAALRRAREERRWTR